MIFEEFKKIPRLSREMVITQKIDGTNGQIWIANKLDIAGDLSSGFAGYLDYKVAETETEVLFAGSRSRWLTEKEDNQGFFKWVRENSECLFQLGNGRHYGEWWGLGIQRGYGIKEKRFSLFNTYRWALERLKCCHVVPILYEGMFDTKKIDEVLEDLKNHGSYASPFMNPEGIIIFHKAANYLFKKTVDKDEKGKGEQG